MSDQSQVLDASARLLKAIDAGDWDAYAKLCDPGITCFEPEARGNLVAGMPFHKYYFDLPSSGTPRQSSIATPVVRLMGDVAVVCYVRLVQKLDAQGQPVTAAMEETRVWQKQSGEWKHVHFHRSPC
ncbi:MAG: nuclear transport factor 2 family protein [Planctomyces sp.]|nr:nuclear transport factor 2 family protein [Planctomyces sp.]